MRYFVLIALLGFAAQAFGKVEITFLPESRIQLSGDSTLRKYAATATAVSITGTAEEKPVAGLPWTPSLVEMQLQVKNLKSDSETLDNHMHKNLKADKFAVIGLKLTGFAIAEKSVTATGTLTVAGVTKPVELKGDFSIDGAKVNIRGKHLLKMSDFAIDPPTMMLGTMKTHDEIEISFDVICLLNNKKESI